MSAAQDTQDRLRVFLTADTPELLIHLHLLEDALAECECLSLEPHLIEPLAADPAPLRTGTGREMREGDVLLALVFDSGAPSKQLVATVERARQRQLLVLPFHASGGDMFFEPLSSPYATRFDPTEEPDALVRIAVATLFDTLRLVSPRTDLLGNCSAEEATAIKLLEEEPSPVASELGAAAHESCQQAARAIRARLYEPALAALARAQEFDTTSAITAYWRARLLTVIGDASRLGEARIEAARASRLADTSTPDTALWLAAWWMQARIAALIGEKDSLLEALDKVGASPTAPVEVLLPALRFLSMGGFQDTALEWLTMAFAADVTFLDHALEDPLLAPLMPTMRRFREKHRKHLLEILEPLLASEKQLYQTWNEGSQNALDAFTQVAAKDWTETPLSTLQAAVQDALYRQLEELNGWSESLINEILEARQARAVRTRLVEADEEVPDVGRVDSLLENCWPRLREKRDELAAALRETERAVRRLQTRERTIEESLRSQLQRFLACAERFERNTVGAPEQVAAINGRAELKGEPLRVSTIDALAADGISGDGRLLPDALVAYLGEEPVLPDGPALYRLEPHRQAGPVASRAGVYFHRAYRRSARARAK